MEDPIADPGECRCCCDDIDDETRCLYQTNKSDGWYEALYCIECVRYLIATRFDSYIKAVQDSDCAKELGGLISRGPPVWLEDGGLPTPKGESIIWIKSVSGEPETAQYTGAPIGELRRQLWDMIILVVQPCIEAQEADQVAQIAEAEERYMRRKLERLSLEKKE
jgi:hypothetical protein